MKGTQLRNSVLLLLIIGAVPFGSAQQKKLMKTVIGTCYDVDPDFLPAIDSAGRRLRSSPVPCQRQTHSLH